LTTFRGSGRRRSSWLKRRARSSAAFAATALRPGSEHAFVKGLLKDIPPAPSSGGWIVAADVFLGITGPRLIDDDRHEVSYWIRLGRPV
jgi:hypothetical protein